jgi:YNFM family putative membrane transporter
VIERGTAAFWRTNLGLFAAGLATFALLYCVQPLMPLFAQVFRVTPAQSALTLSVTTLPLAFAMLVASGISEAVGRKPVMVASLLASSVLAVLSALAPGFGALLLLRGLMGLTLSGLPAVAMAYVAEEMHPKVAGLAMGLYIGGSAIGGLSGRLLSGALADLSSWRTALAAVGAEGLACGLLLWRGLPDSLHFTPRPLHPRGLARSTLAHLRRPVLPWLFAEGFLLMGTFVTLYNFIGYRLMAPPYSLSQTSVGLIFCVYLAGVVSSPVMGNLATRIGRRPVMVGNILAMLAGLALTLAAPLAAIVGGVALVTAGFFGAHSVASNWVGFRATEARAQASALYLFAYYAGSSVVGYAGGLVFQQHGWTGICTLLGLLLLPAMVIPVWLPGRK